VKQYLVKANPPPTPLSLEMAPAVGPPEISPFKGALCAEVIRLNEQSEFTHGGSLVAAGRLEGFVNTRQTPHPSFDKLAL